MSNKSGCIALAAVFMTSIASAGALYETPVSSCGTLNCSGMTIRGIHQSREPFVIQVYAREGECLRLDVSTQTEDMVLLWTTPFVYESEIWDDRDFDGGDFRPLFTYDPLPYTGWHTIVISYFDYDDRVGRFTLEYGRYPSGNVNCQEAPAATSSQKRAGHSAARVKFGPSAEASRVAGPQE